MTITLATTADCDAAEAICTSDGTALTDVPGAVTIPGPSDDEPTVPANPLTASFSSMPAEHGGPGEGARFTFVLTFSENPEVGYAKLRDDAFSVSGGDVKTAQRRQQGSNVAWNITVEPEGWGNVGLSLPGGRACTAHGALCTADNRMLSNSPSATIQGPAGLSVADASAHENILDTRTGDALDMTLRTDALWLKTTSDATPEMAAPTANVTRLRLIVDASRGFAVGMAGTLTPSIEAGIRRDAGDAEEGTGFEVGAGLSYQGAGISIEGKVRTLIVHDDSAYEEWGASGSVRIDPGTSGRGLSLSITPTWGNAASEAEQLWSARDAGGLVRNENFEAESRLNAEVGYGVGAPQELGVITPCTALTRSDGNSRTWRAGARWKVSDAISLTLEGAREERGGDEAPSDAVMLRLSARF